MTQAHRILIAGTAALAGGLLAASLIAPERMRATGRVVSRRVPLPSRADLRLDEVEERLSALERQIHDTTEDFRRRLAEAGERTLERYTPGDPLAGEEWHLKRGDVDEDLPRLRGRG